MSTARSISEYLSSPCPDEDGEERGTRLLPPLSATEISELEKAYGCIFTEDVRELLTYCGGLEHGPMERIEFGGSETDYLMPSLRGRFRSIAPDGFGNFWFYWTTHVGPGLGPVFYYQHEGPMIFHQSAGIGEFVHECIRLMTPPYVSLIDDVHEFRLRPIPTLIDDLISRDTALAGADHELVDFVRHLPSDALVFDFRSSKVGDGVDLARLQVIALHPKLPVLAVRRRVGLLGRLASFFRTRKT